MLGGYSVKAFRVHLLHDESTATLLELGEAVIGLQPRVDGNTACTAIEVGVEGDHLRPAGLGAVDKAHAEPAGGGTRLQVAGQSQAGLGALCLAEDERGAGRGHIFAQAPLVAVAIDGDVKTLVQQTQCCGRAGLARSDDGGLASMFRRHDATIGV
ncbi:Uncharacterised protein [Mycobacteroides abscessus subsp. abscessus]|nr:Uncharacterised protein [Mycobacteroides abscessus subsp. abscessus]SKU14955.1 Uncharacterised protein [Mycobacteroides abscessus subsp. abscessus]